MFNTSARIQIYPSLNHSFYCGPNAIELILVSLCCFRENKLGAIVDINKSCLQLTLPKEDRNFCVCGRAIQKKEIFECLDILELYLEQHVPPLFSHP